MDQISDETLADAKVLWDFHVIPSENDASDFILGLGSSDTRVAVAAANLALNGIAPLVVMSGGLGKVTSATGGESEAARFAREAERLGVPKSKVLLEEQATNTGENFTKTRALLAEMGTKVAIGTFVTKPYMKRRALATAQAQWPEILWRPHAPDIAFDAYPDEEISTRQMIDLMVGDLQRFEVYSKRGFQVAQHVPENVWQAYRSLVAKGFDRYVIPT